jgi:hypothetical protein
MSVYYTKPQFSLREQESRWRQRADGGRSYSWAIDLYICELCGALAEDTDTHLDWHIAHGDTA